MPPTRSVHLIRLGRDKNAPPAAPTLAFFFYARARALGLADMGRKVDLVERSIRRGEADPELADTLRRKAQRKSL